MINIKFKSGYSMDFVSTANADIIEKVCEKCSDYYRLHDGVLPSKEDVDELFAALPPDKQFEDKFVIGIFNENNLVGIADIVRDYPTVGEWMLGLLLIQPEERGSGLGKAVHKALSDWAADLGATSLRIGVIKENRPGIHFWAGLGYKKIKEVSMDFKAKTHSVFVMKLPL